MTARVLTVDPSKLTLHLTLKPTLLNPELAVVASYEEVEIGKAYTGVVKVRDCGGTPLMWYAWATLLYISLTAYFTRLI